MRSRRTRHEEFVQVAVDHGFDDRAVGPALFGQRDEQRTRARRDDGVAARRRAIAAW